MGREGRKMGSRSAVGWKMGVVCVQGGGKLLTAVLGGRGMDAERAMSAEWTGQCQVEIFSAGNE